MAEVVESKPRSLAGEYVASLARGWWSLMVGIVGGITYLADYAMKQFDYALLVPKWIPLTVALAGIFVAQVVAFAEMRRQRDKGLVGQSDLPSTRLTKQVAQLLANVTGRRLAPSAANVLSRALASGLGNYWKQLPHAKRKQLKVTLISIGREREALDYRADFAKAFAAGGFDVATNEWDAGPPELESFTGVLTLLPSPKMPPNAEMRGIVTAALQAASLEYRDAPFPSISSYDSEGRIVKEGVVSGSFSAFIFENAVHLVIGQRG